MSEEQQWINLVLVLAGTAVLFSFLFNWKVRWWKRFLASLVLSVLMYVFVIVTLPYMDAAEVKWGVALAPWADTNS